MTRGQQKIDTMSSDLAEWGKLTPRPFDEKLRMPKRGGFHLEGLPFKALRIRICVKKFIFSPGDMKYLHEQTIL